MKEYKLGIVAVHSEEQRIYMSKGHHSTEDFLRALEEYGEDMDDFTPPEHLIVNKVPVPKKNGYHFLLSFVKEGSRGSFPATYVWEKY